MKRHRGASLTEALVIMAVGGVIAGLSIDILHNSQVNAKNAQNSLTVQRSVAQWESKLRSDLRSATSAELADPETLVVKLDSAEATYEVSAGHVERTLSRGDQVLHREGYRLPDCSVTLSLADANQVLVEIDPQQQTKANRSFLIRQTIGRGQ